MSGDFEEFTRAVAQHRPGPSGGNAPVAPVVSRVAVLGGGADARLIAALALAARCRVTLFSAYGKELDLLRASSGISLRGAGPIGTYHVDGDPATSVQLTAELDAAVQGADVIFLTGPIHKQRTYAMVLADHLSDGQVLVIAPGRSLGAVETAWHLRLGGAQADITIVEAQGLPFWLRSEGAVLHLSPAGPVAAACLPKGRAGVVASLAPILPNLTEVDSVLACGFADLSAAVDLPALLLGGAGLVPGGVHVPMGGVPLPENTTFGALLGADQRRLVEKLAEERRAVARAFGVRNLPDTSDWIAATAGPDKGPDKQTGARPVPDRTEALALVRDGVLGSLVPLMSAADLAGTPVPLTRALVALAAGILDADVAVAGRRLDTMGIATTSTEDARRAMDALLTAGS